ncbi:beta family protein [Streptomyces sp. A0958]|uniref:beta family protein n=1 Tax=Streptomyces sp. A0958 TaxID=2563101 RepID=UPI001F0FA614|nr:beta family protein [Streptomyces sp. A0958]
MFRYVPFTIEQDGTVEPEYEARCVSGDEVECGAWSGTCIGPEPVEEWQRRHTQESGHRRYRRNFGDYAVMRPAGLAGSNGGAV